MTNPAFPKVSPAEAASVIAGMKDAPTLLESLVSAVPQDRLMEVRRPNAWSIHEHLTHLAEVQQLGLDRLTRMMKEDNPEFQPYFPDEDPNRGKGELTTEQALAVFRKKRMVQVELLEKATEEDWQRLARHPEYDPFGLYIFARHILMHDHWHMYRMEQLWLTREEFLEE